MSEPRTAPPRAAVVAAAVLVGLLAVGVVVASRFAPDAGQEQPPQVAAGPLGLVPVDAPQATAPECAGLLAALPRELPSGGGVLAALPLADPAPAGATAWGDRMDPVVLRCGLRKPPELTPTAALQVVSGVQWLPVRGTGSTTWFLVDRAVYAALTMPDAAGSGPLQTVSEVVAAELKAQPVDP
ncbi:DUF3515 domain-containing protein [Actinokineospora soli]|uniref:DUF3515 domain-containing protein n=1 Tax=Actinokineospora soli TaxID=1048753 RepID=A0ABW2TV28_9PSEU